MRLLRRPTAALLSDAWPCSSHALPLMLYRCIRIYAMLDSLLLPAHAFYLLLP